jgi:tetratricopeptide (TPR) repeat protein
MQLIRSDDDRVIWSNDYDEPAGIDGVNAAQSAAALDIARILRAGVSQPSAIAVARPLTKDSAALRLYRLGRHLYNKGGVADMRKSVQYFKEAIARDSGFARAYVGLADATAFVGEDDLRPAREWQPETERYLRKAITLDETIPEAHSLLAFYYSDYAFDSVSAEQQHRRALQLNPQSVEVHLWYGAYLLDLEQLDEAIVEYKRAVELDPMMPLVRGHLARALIFAGKDNLALPHIQQGMELYPDWPMFPHLLAMILVRRRMNDSAVAVLNRSDKTPWNGWLYGVAGRTDTTRRILDSLMVESEKRPVDPIGIAVVQMGMGNREQALAWLERAYAERSSGLRFFLGPHLAFAPLRNDPRFQALRRRVGFSR